MRLSSKMENFLTDHVLHVRKNWPMLLRFTHNWQAGRLALNAGANHFTDPTYRAKVHLRIAAASGDIPTRVNKGRWDGPLSSLLLLDVFALHLGKRLSIGQKNNISKRKIVTSLFCSLDGSMVLQSLGQRLQAVYVTTCSV